MVEECPADESTKFVQNINIETNEKTVIQTAQEIQHTFGSLKQVNFLRMIRIDIQEIRLLLFLYFHRYSLSMYIEVC